MSRLALLLGIAMMLAIANTFPGFVRPYSLTGTSQSEIGASPAAAGLLCYNCSDLATVSSGELPVSSQLMSQLLPSNSPVMTTPGRISSDEDDAWAWRGKVKSRWESLGFDSGIFELFIRMKGAKTRFSLLEALSVPKDRMQLAQELGLDWKSIDYQVVRLNRCGLVQEERVFGQVKFYRITASGEVLLRLLKESDNEIRPMYQ